MARNLPLSDKGKMMTWQVLEMMWAGLYPSALHCKGAITNAKFEQQKTVWLTRR